MSRELQPPVSISLVKLELPTVIKNEPPESEIVEIGMDDILNSSESEEIIPDVKGIDIVYHPVCEDSIKSEILESKHCESVEKRVLVKAEDSPFIKTENIMTEDTSDENVTKGTGQAVVEMQASNEHSNALINLEIDEQSVLNFSKDLNNMSVRSRKFKSPKKTDFADCCKTHDTTLWKKEKEKIKVIKAPVIPVEAHEYTYLANDRHICNHCQQTYKKLQYLKEHIKQMHREVTTMYQCPYCSYESKWKSTIPSHIIQNHKDIKDIQWFQCNSCEMKFKLKKFLTLHMKVHLKHKQMQDGLDLREKRYECDKCNYKTYRVGDLKRHNLIHLKPLKEIKYFYCYHCSYKTNRKMSLKGHIFRHHFKNVKQGKRHHCDMCNYETWSSTNLKRHKIIHLKPEEIKYFYCYHCSYKSNSKSNLKAHIFRHHFKNVRQGKRHHCDMCNYETWSSTHLKSHKIIHLKPEEIEYFYCYHCSYKSIKKENLKRHIFSHFKNEEIRFHCYICDFVRLKRDLIIEHIGKHFKNRNKYDETISKYQLESRINNLTKKVSK